MTKLIKMVLMISLLGATVSFADAKKGKKIYMKSLKSKFGNMNGAKFASLYNMEEWKELFEENSEGFIEEFSERFPKAEKILNRKKTLKKLLHVRDFVIKYASDSGNIITCGD